jgi:hypothetical protein
MDWSSLKAQGPKIFVDETLFDPKPESLGINTMGGWKDSASINWLGSMLSYTYFRADPFYYMIYGEERLGPAKPGWPDEAKYPGSRLGAEIYLAIETRFFGSNQWSESPAWGPANTPYGAEGCQQLSEDSKTLLFSRSWGGQRGLFRCDFVGNQFQEPKLLPATINQYPLTSNTADNPFMTPTGVLLFDRGPNANRKIWRCRQVSDSYTTPVEVTAVNEVGVDITQPWMSPDGTAILYARNHAAICLYRTDWKTSAGVNPRPLVVMQPGDPTAGAIGEPTMDQNGNLYFVYVFVLTRDDGRKEFDCDVFRLRAKKPVRDMPEWSDAPIATHAWLGEDLPEMRRRFRSAAV